MWSKGIAVVKEFLVKNIPLIKEKLLVIDGKISSLIHQYLPNKSPKNIKIIAVVFLSLFLLVTFSVDSSKNVSDQDKNTQPLLADTPIKKQSSQVSEKDERLVDGVVLRKRSKEQTKKRSKEQIRADKINDLPEMEDLTHYDSPNDIMGAYLLNSPSSFSFRNYEAIDLGFFTVIPDKTKMGEFELADKIFEAEKKLAQYSEKLNQDLENGNFLNGCRLVNLEIPASLNANGRITITKENLAKYIPYHQSRKHIFKIDDKKDWIEEVFGKEYRDFFLLDHKGERIKKHLYGVTTLMGDNRSHPDLEFNLEGNGRDETRKLINELGKKNKGNAIITEISFRFNRVYTEYYRIDSITKKQIITMFKAQSVALELFLSPTSIKFKNSEKRFIANSHNSYKAID